MKCNLYAVPAFHCKSALLNERHFWISVFNTFKCLREPSKHVGALSKRELLAGNVVPTKLHTLPPFRPEVVGIFTPYILVSAWRQNSHSPGFREVQRLVPFPGAHSQWRLRSPSNRVACYGQQASKDESLSYESAEI